MQRRDSIIIQKVLSELDIGIRMLGDCSIDTFLADEMLNNDRRILVTSVVS